MPVFTYNVRTPTKNFMVSDPAHKSFTENLITKDAPRNAWSKMMLFVQKENILNKERLYPDRVFVKISSIEALQCKNENEFKNLTSELIKHGATLYSIAEEAVFDKEHPNGISSDLEKLEKAKSSTLSNIESHKNAKKNLNPAVAPKNRHVIEI